MKLHEGTLFVISKRVNGGPWLGYGSGYETREQAAEVMETARAFHAERCPKDRVDWSITKVY